MHDVAHRKLADLAADRPRNVLNLDDLLRDMKRARVGTYLMSDARTQGFIECQAFLKADEQNDAHVAGGIAGDILADRHALDDFGELIDLPVDLGCSNPDSGRVECRVAPSVYDHPVVLCQLA